MIPLVDPLIESIIEYIIWGRNSKFNNHNDSRGLFLRSGTFHQDVCRNMCYLVNSVFLSIYISTYTLFKCSQLCCTWKIPSHAFLPVFLARQAGLCKIPQAALNTLKLGQHCYCRARERERRREAAKKSQARDRNSQIHRHTHTHINRDKHTQAHTLYHSTCTHLAHLQGAHRPVCL